MDTREGERANRAARGASNVCRDRTRMSAVIQSIRSTINGAIEVSRTTEGEGVATDRIGQGVHASEARDNTGDIARIAARDINRIAAHIVSQGARVRTATTQGIDGTRAI